MTMLPDDVASDKTPENVTDCPAASIVFVDEEPNKKLLPTVIELSALSVPPVIAPVAVEGRLLIDWVVPEEALAATTRFQ